jgi:hypothetical protein
MDNQLFDDGEFVFYKQKGDNDTDEIIGGGYKINSFFLQGGMAPLTTMNNENYDQDGGKVSTPFENLAVPAGLFYINQRVPKNKDTVEEHYYKKHEALTDDMIDKLFGLVEVDKKRKRKTRKHTNNANKTINSDKNQLSTKKKSRKNNK